MGPYMSEMRRLMLLNQPPEPCRECHTDLIAHNRQVATNLAALQTEHAARHAGPAYLVTKAVNSVRKHGVRRSFQRGKEWLAIRRSMAEK